MLPEAVPGYLFELLGRGRHLLLLHVLLLPPGSRKQNIFGCEIAGGPLVGENHALLAGAAFVAAAVTVSPFLPLLLLPGLLLARPLWCSTAKHPTAAAAGVAMLQHDITTKP